MTKLKKTMEVRGLLKLFLQEKGRTQHSAGVCIGQIAGLGSVVRLQGLGSAMEVNSANNVVMALRDP